MTRKDITKFHKIVYTYFESNPRSLPWRGRGISPYQILVSEIMLQQTQADRVIPKFNEFIKKFPVFPTLARSPLSQILTLWSGLGYNRRALYLRQLAQTIVKDYNGFLPKDEKLLATLPGIGKATAAAIATYAFNKPTIFIETNIKTVFIHHFFSDLQSVSDQEILPLIKQTLDRTNPRKWYWALMDYGAMLKKKYGNANRQSAPYTKQSKFEGSNRQVRGLILKHLLHHSSTSAVRLSQKISRDHEVVKLNLLHLKEEGLVKQKNDSITLA